MASGSRRGQAFELCDLLRNVEDAVLPGNARGVQVTAITPDSRQVAPGNLYVAIRGTRTDGHHFIPDALRRGAVAVIAEEEVSGDPGVPWIRVRNTRRALAALAAAWHGHPADRLRLLGITGTLGKTSVLKMLEAMIRQDGGRIGTIGSLGMSLSSERGPPGYTAPAPLLLHGALRHFADSGCKVVAMEVTSHALDQDRVHGLEYALGIFTNLVPLEHADYHGTFRRYVDVKRRFFEHLSCGTPLVHWAGDPTVRRLVREHDVTPIGCGNGRSAMVRIDSLEFDEEGTAFALNVRRPLPRIDGGEVPPLRLPVRMRLLGRSHAVNAALAATAALCLGMTREAIESTLRSFPPPRRRMEILRRAPFTLLDDTLGHPESVSAVFEVVEHLPAQRVHAIFSIRGQRGAPINRQVAEAVAIGVEKRPFTTLIVTRSTDAADERNRVEEPEREAFLEPLRRAGIDFEEHDALADAVPAALDRVGEGDLLLLLGAQGMDRGAEEVQAWLNGRDVE